MQTVAETLQTLLIQPPASFRFTDAPPVIVHRDGVTTRRPRLMGMAPGAVISIEASKVELAVIMPPDAPRLAKHHSVLALLVLTAMRPDWDEAGLWLADALTRCAAGAWEINDYSRQVTLWWDAKTSRMTLAVEVV